MWNSLAKGHFHHFAPSPSSDDGPLSLSYIGVSCAQHLPSRVPHSNQHLAEVPGPDRFLWSSFLSVPQSRFSYRQSSGSTSVYDSTFCTFVVV